MGKSGSTLTAQEMQNIRKLSAERHLTLTAVAKGVGVSAYKLAGGLLPLYREAVETIERLQSEAAAEEVGGDEVVSTQIPVDTDEDQSPAAAENGINPLGSSDVPEGRNHNHESAKGEARLPAETEDLSAHAPLISPTRKEDSDMSDKSPTFEIDQAVKLANVTADVNRALQDVKELQTTTKEHADTLRETEKMRQMLGQVNTSLAEVQAALRKDEEERKSLAEQLQSNAQQLEEHNGKLQQPVTLTPEQVEEAMVRCVQEGGTFCELLSKDVQRRAKEAGQQVRGEHDHAGAEEFWDCPTCSKSLMGVLGTERFGDMRKSMIRALPEEDIPVLLERLQAAGMKVVKETDSIFMPHREVESQP